jgi:beta-glucosidase
MTDDKNLIPSYYTGDVEQVSDKEFATLLGRELSPREYEEGYKVTKYHDLYDTQHTKWGKRICKLVVKAAGGVSKDDLGSEDMSGKMALQTPIEAMVNFAGGVLTNKSKNALIDFINGDKPFRAAMRLLGGIIISPITIRKFRKNELFK